MLTVIFKLDSSDIPSYAVLLPTRSAFYPLVHKFKLQREN